MSATEFPAFLRDGADNDAAAACLARRNQVRHSAHPSEGCFAGETGGGAGGGAGVDSWKRKESGKEKP